MGICTSLACQEFRIKKDRVPEAFRAVRGYIEQDIAQSRHAPSCPYPDEAVKATTLAEQFGAWSWALQLDGEGNVVGIGFRGEKEKDVAGLFAAVAPYVDAGCFIEMVDEYHFRSRWDFDGQTCR